MLTTLLDALVLIVQVVCAMELMYGAWLVFRYAPTITTPTHPRQAQVKSAQPINIDIATPHLSN